MTPDDLGAALAAQSGWPGVRRARVVLLVAGPDRESPLESWSAWAFHWAGLPQPEWQVEIQDGAGAFVARVDCWWPGVAGEADGRSTYELGAAERGGGAVALYEVLHAERRRERDPREVGVDVLRWAAADVLRPAPLHDLARRIRAAVTEAERAGRFLGRAASLTPRSP